MYFVEKIFDDNLFNTSELPQDFIKEDCIFFDIETAGLSPKTSHVFLIGLCFFKNNKIVFRQYFANSIEEEYEILKGFIEDVSQYKTIYHFNGLSFDIPYVNERLSVNKIKYKLSKENSFDIYKAIKNNKKILNLNSYKLKSIEQYIGIYREDDLSGAEIVQAYFEFVENNNHHIREKILLHNEEDIINLYRILPLVEFDETKNYNLKVECLFFKAENNIVCFSGKIKLQKEKQVNIKNNDYMFSWNPNTEIFTLTFPILHGNLYYFYENRKDYYYIPEIDQAIHKSVLKYYQVKEKLKANSKNCYSRINIGYVKFPINIKSDLLKMSSNDKNTNCNCISLPDIEKYIDNEELYKIIGAVIKKISG